MNGTYEVPVANFQLPAESSANDRIVQQLTTDN
jgi:hypothetical protein